MQSQRWCRTAMIAIWSSLSLTLNGVDVKCLIMWHVMPMLIGDATEAALLIDESGFAKQGKMSVGASRQYLGRLGKVDNGQVAVFGVLAKGRFATAIDTRLYLPKEWTDDEQRCNKAGIPESERVFKTKSQLALEIVEQARRNGVRFGWVGADAGYGSGPDFLFALADAG